MKSLNYIHWLKDSGKVIKTLDGKDIRIFELRHKKDNKILSAWAKHFRNHYCDDKIINKLIKNTGHSKKTYLTQIKFPDHKQTPGPSVRSGDFAEILVADYLAFILNYWIPDKYKYANKRNRNESIKGCDIIGFHLAKSRNPMDDILSIYEVKAQSSGKKLDHRLQAAVDDSSQDSIRKAETLNAIKQRFVECNLDGNAEKIERFQNINDKPFTEKYNAVAVFEGSLYNEDILKKTDTSTHLRANVLSLMIIKISNMKQLISDLYERSANEA